MDLTQLAVLAADFTPVEFGTTLAGGVTTILAWVGAGVVGAIPVALALIGIRRGISAFRANAK